MVVRNNSVTDVHGLARPDCASDPCSKHVRCEAAGFRYRFEGIEVGDSVSGAEISHNTITNIPFGYGIYYGGGNTASENALIADNTIAAAFDYGIHVDSRGSGGRTRNVSILRNHVTGSSPAGLLLSNTADVRVISNTFTDSGPLSGVGVAPACVGCVMQGNAATGAAPRSIWGGKEKTDDKESYPSANERTTAATSRPIMTPLGVDCVVNGTARASCFGTNASDSTDILQAALSSGASTVLIDDIGKPWIVRPLFVTANDSSIIFGRNVRLLAKRNEFHGYNDALLSFRGVRNITVVGNNATLQMRRADYAVPSWGSCPSCRPYKKSEWRAGIMIAQSDDLRISGLNIVESGGDGFYIHCAPGCRNLHISDCVADSNYRQGMVGEQSSLTRLAYAVA